MTPLTRWWDSPVTEPKMYLVGVIFLCVPLFLIACLWVAAPDPTHAEFVDRKGRLVRTKIPHAAMRHRVSAVILLITVPFLTAVSLMVYGIGSHTERAGFNVVFVVELAVIVAIHPGWHIRWWGLFSGLLDFVMAAGFLLAWTRPVGAASPPPRSPSSR